MRAPGTKRSRGPAVVLAACSVVLAACLASPVRAGEAPDGRTAKVVVDGQFPGGNIVLDGIEGDTVTLHQDLRDTQGDWFYWYFRVRGAQGRTLRFRFTRGNPIGTRGPAVSTDDGRTWDWLGAQAAGGPAFRYRFAPEAREVRFCLAIPYLEANLKEFLERHAGDRRLTSDVLCRSPKSRNVELLHLGRLDGRAPHRVLLTCRHHCCEMIASYSLEGLMETVLSGDPDGRWLRDNVEFLIVPFMDKDGVEEGDQGKNRKPHDHNRDYAGASLYPSVAALRERVPRWSQGRLEFALDLHCPFIRGAYNENIYFVGGPNQELWSRVGRFGAILESVQTGPLHYHVKDNLPYGTAWNQSQGDLKSFSRWAAELPGIRIGTSLEIPYANVGTTTVTADNARAFGRDLACALRRYLEQPTP